MLVSCVATSACTDGTAEPTYTPRDVALRALPLFFYPSLGGDGARAFVFFFGNDVGFWKPHRELAAALAQQGYDVVGYDMKPLLAALPDGSQRRDSVFTSTITAIIGAARHELGADTLPLVLAGHSLGAEVATWTAANVTLPRLTGVLALSPGSRSHLRVSMSDLAAGGEPTGPGSFAIAAEVAALPRDVRYAIVRGVHDRYSFADSALEVAGGDRVQRYLVRFAGHSLKRITVARPVVRRALAWLIEPDAAGFASR